MARDTLWQTKLHARLHDPAEKALVLLRDPAGHEGGTSRELHSLLFKDDMPAVIRQTVKRADWWAAAADRPQWPKQEIATPAADGQATQRRIVDWAQVRWTKRPILIHPLNGKETNLGTLADTEIGDIKSRSLAHFEGLVLRDEGGDQIDWRRTLLAFWRFGPELWKEKDNSFLGELWRLLPGDTRVPDHSIWDHLDLTSAFAGAFAEDANGDAALLVMSLGPVQGFITAARSTSDLWAGSHLLSQLAWEATKAVSERLGPDAVLFPRLRTIPQVDVWLRDECQLPKEWFANCANCQWMHKETDANPLFSAALPNRFVAVVPADQAVELAKSIEARVRKWLETIGLEVVDRLLETARFRKEGDSRNESLYAYRQMREQLDGFSRSALGERPVLANPSTR